MVSTWYVVGRLPAGHLLGVLRLPAGYLLGGLRLPAGYRPGRRGRCPPGNPNGAEPTPRQVARRMESRPAAWDADRPHAMAAEPELRDSAGERQEGSAPRPRPRRSFCPALNDRGARIQEIVGTDPCRAPAPFRSRFRRARRHRVGNGMGPAGTPKRHTVLTAGA